MARTLAALLHIKVSAQRSASFLALDFDDVIYEYAGEYKRIITVSSVQLAIRILVSNILIMLKR